MSVLGKKWLIKNSSQDKSTLEKLMGNRMARGLKGLTDFYDPALFEQMPLALDRIDKAINEKEKIVVFGDYDVDGISGTAILVNILREIGANVSYALPNRVEDGYGLSGKFIDQFAKEGVKMIITVDCGISCPDPVKKAKEYGIDTIVTDHHTIPEVTPNAVSILHPKLGKYPFKELTGSGVAFKLAHALIKKYFPEKENELEKYVDLAALGTVADIGLLIGENRLIVKRGLEKLKNTNWIGLEEIVRLTGLEGKKTLESFDIGFKIAPRINAAGRISDPLVALELLLKKDRGNLTDLGEKLEELNQERKEMTIKAFDEIDNQLYEEGNDPPYIFIKSSPSWHVGIIGLVASRLVEKYGRPAIIMQDRGDTLTASARSPECFDITKAITAQSKYLINYGGHAQAAGFNMKKSNLPAFEKAMASYAEQELSTVDLRPVLEIDCELSNKDLTRDFVKEMGKLSPFGAGNQNPVFMLKDIEPHFVEQVGKDRDHLKFSLLNKQKYIKVIGFNMGDKADVIRKQRKIDIAFHLEKDDWKGRKSIQLQALDFR